MQTHRPSSLAALVRATRFTEAELKRIYRGFKAECPTGLVKEDAFKLIYQQFFPQGGGYHSKVFAKYLLGTCKHRKFDPGFAKFYIFYLKRNKCYCYYTFEMTEWLAVVTGMSTSRSRNSSRQILRRTHH